MSGLAPSFERPTLLALLVLPALAWWLTRRPRRPLERATGTLALWRRAAGETPPQGGRARPRPPRAVLAALTLGVLALAGPRTARAPRAIWRVVVDRSPSMYLAHEAGGTRLERALGRLDGVLASLGPLELRWLAYDGDGFLELAVEEPPASWLRAPAGPHPEPDWAQVDLARTLWVTDAEPALEPRRAGRVLAGGAAVPGPAAVEADGALLFFDGRGLTRTGGRAAPRAVRVAPGVPAPIRALVEVWAAERGLELRAGDGDGPPALVVDGPQDADGARGARAALTLGRDGWSLAVEALPEGLPWAPGPDGLVGAPWLEREGVVHARGAPGRVELSFDRAAAPSGDAAAFAVSLAGLLDACLAPPAGVVPVAERLAAGAGRTELPGATGETGGTDRTPGAPGAWLEAALAGAACLLVLAALGYPLRRGSRADRAAS